MHKSTPMHKEHLDPDYDLFSLIPRLGNGSSAYIPVRPYDTMWCQLLLPGCAL